MTEPWYMVLPFRKAPSQLSRMDYLKLRRFYMQQVALSQALLEAKLPGICKIITSEENQSLGTFQEEVSNDILTSCISPSVDSREMST